jgi:diguanylate cyclase (GGDEF)-like protein
MSILIVDDQAINTRLLETMLQRAGYKDVISASSGDMALQVLCSGRDAKAADIELVLLDIMMPGMSGIDVVKVIRRHAQFARLPVIMATALDEEASLDAAFAAGATDYLTKPFRPIELRARITSALAMSKEIREREKREKELHEITLKLEEVNRSLQVLSMLDGLTGIPNRRHFNETLDREVRRARRTMQETGEPEQVAVIMVDIDYFKQFNDTYGHTVGDEALRAVSAALKRCMRRPGDMVARFGGEEFACILPDTDIEGARKVAEQMRRRVEWLDIAHESSQVSKILTASIGVSAGSVMTDAELVRLADEALYDAKHQGRNRVCERAPKHETAPLVAA